IVDAAQAIAHAHERGIVHRDIKPSNILVGDLGETVVIDWGLAKVIGEPDEQVARPLVDLSDTLKTRAGIVYGTPGFMAPEQLRGAPVDERCDVYALGATLYHLLSRSPPHHAKTADEMMKAAVAAPPTPIRELVAGVPPDLSTIVDKALAHDATQRYQNARELAKDLQRFLTGQLVASHHYSPREKLVRLIRKNRGVSAAVAALVVIGTVLVIRIVVERNRADRAASDAQHAQAVAELHAEELTLTQARYNVDLNPTKAITMVKPLAAKYWREVRAIAAAAHAAGVAWSLPAAKQTLSLDMSHDGVRAVSAGEDGVVRLHDLVRRTTRPVVALGAPVMARFADDDRRLVIWHGDQLTVLDPASGRRRDVTVPMAIHDLEVVRDIAYWVDTRGALWRLGLDGPAPLEIALDEPVRGLAPAPGGRWIALSGEHHLFLLDRSQPAAPALEVMVGTPREVAWSADGEYLGALVDDFVVAVAMAPAPSIIERQTVGQRLYVGFHAGRLYVMGPTGVAILVRSDEAGDVNTRKAISGAPVGLTEARGGTVVTCSPSSRAGCCCGTSTTSSRAACSIR
ncbi:MAG: serine/threonine protein kinase, partial [Deltaproteobacteria bacterium]